LESSSRNSETLNYLCVLYSISEDAPIAMDTNSDSERDVKAPEFADIRLSPISRPIGKASAGGDVENGIGHLSGHSARTVAATDGSAKRRVRAVCCFSVKLSIAVFLTMCMSAAFFDWDIVEQREYSRNRVLVAIFLTGLGVVALEDVLHMDKSSIMLLCAGIMWTVLAVSDDPQKKKGMKKLEKQLDNGVAEVGKLLLFLLPAMGLCESIDHLHGFDVVAHAVKCATFGKKQLLMPVICLFTFALCTVVDSMSAMLVVLKTLRLLEPDDDDWRRQCGALAVLGANACVWSPIGEVTTAMLWIGGKITPAKIAAWLFIPSLASLLVPLSVLWGMALFRRAKVEEDAIELSRSDFAKISPKNVDLESTELFDNVSGFFDGVDTPTSDDAGSDNGSKKNPSGRFPTPSEADSDGGTGETKPGEVVELYAAEDHRVGELTRSSISVFCLGVGCIVTVPLLKMNTSLPPYFGMLFALGLMWFVTDIFGVGINGNGGVIAALHKVDLPGLLFFAGVLQSVAALDAAHILRWFASILKDTFGGNPVTMSISLGFASALVDNVPLVQAAIDMFVDVPADDPLWQLVALAAGTGGSLLSTGGIAGVTFMGVEGISFMWYLKNVSLFAVVGFFAGILTYMLQTAIVG